MFDHFTLGTQARLAADDVDKEPYLSPKQRPRELNPPTTAFKSNASPNTHNQSVTPQQPIDNLTRELSQQTLIPHALRRPAARSVSPGALPFIIESLSAIPLEVDDDCQMDMSMDDVKEHQSVVDWKRSRRQWHSRFANNPNNARDIQARIHDMITEKSQCNVHPAPLSSASSMSNHMVLPTIEPDDNPALDLNPLLEPDEGFCEEGDGLSLAADRKRLLGISSMRKYGALRFRGSAETALRCQNVVRHRPRMRKRKGPGPTQDPRPS